MPCHQLPQLASIAGPRAARAWGFRGLAFPSASVVCGSHSAPRRFVGGGESPVSRLLRRPGSTRLQTSPSSPGSPGSRPRPRNHRLGREALLPPSNRWPGDASQWIAGSRSARVACRFVRSPRRSYLAVVTASACPTSSCTVRRSTPAASNELTNARLNA